jgi:hypothetical protein
VGQPEKIEDLKFLPIKKRLAYNSNGDVEYVGVSERGLSEASEAWKINKYSYDINNNLILVESGYGSWNNRVTLVYG